MYKEAFKSWKLNTNERQKLQSVYAVALVLSLVIAGFVSLLNPEFGRSILNISFVAFGILVFNTLVWALIGMWIQYQTPATRPGSTRKK